MKDVNIISKVVTRKSKEGVITPSAVRSSVSMEGYLKEKVWDSVFEVKTDTNGVPYIFVKAALVTQYGITLYRDNGLLDLPSIYDGLPIDGQTIYWENGILKAKGGGAMPDLTNYATIDYVNDRLNAIVSGAPDAFDTLNEIAEVLQGNVNSIGDILSVLGTKFDKDNFTKSNIKSTLGISDWALAESKPSYTYTEISGTPDLSVYALKTSLSSYQPLISTTNKLAYSLVSGTPTSLKNPTSLTFGSKTYDGSEAKTIVASDLGALTSHQTIYALTLQAGTFSAGTYTPNSSAKTINIPTTTAHISESGNLYFTNARAVSALSSTLASYVTLGGSQTITGAKNFTGGLSVNGGSLVYNAAEGYWKLEGNLLVTGGVSMYNSGDSDIPSGGGGSIDYPLSWSGFSSGSFDGSAAKTIYIPSKLSELTNDSGYALSSALSGYLPLSGGTIANSGAEFFTINRTDGEYSVINFQLGGIWVGYMGFKVNSGPVVMWNNDYRTIYHSGIFNPSDYLPLTGGVLTGNILFGNASTGLNTTALGSRFPSHLYRNVYDNSGGVGNVYDHYFNNEYTACTYTFANLRVKNGSYFRTLRFGGDGTFTWNDNNVLHSSNYSSYALPINGGLMGGAIQWGSASAPVSINASGGCLSLDSVDGEICIAGGNDNSIHVNFRKSAYGYAPARWYFRAGSSTSYANIYAGNLYSNGNSVIHSGNIGSQSVANADKLDGLHATDLLTSISSNSTTNLSITVGGTTKTITSSYSTYTKRFHAVWNNPSSGSFDLNTHYNGGIARYYGSGGSLTNAPTSFGYGSVLSLSSGAQALCGQLAWNINSGSTSDVTKNLYWRASDSSNVFAYAKWHQIAFTDSNVASATKLQTARTIWGQSFDGTRNVSGNLMMSNNTCIQWYDTEGIAKNLLHLSKGNIFYIGHAAATSSYNTYLDGYNVYLRHGTAPTVGLTLKSGGNVGIGTATPAYKLDVAGDIQADGWIRTKGDTGWYSQTYGGGWYMKDNLYLRSRNSFPVFVGNSIYIGTNSGDGKGLALYYESDPNNYGIHMSKTSTYGTHGSVTQDWAMYFCFTGNTNRGFIFKHADTNVASISGLGNLTLNGSATIGGTLSVSGAATFSSTLYAQQGITIANNRSIYSYDTGGTSRNVLALDSSNNFVIGNGTASAGYNTYLSGNTVYLRYGTSRTTGLTLGSDGAVSIAKTLSVSGASTFTGKTTHNGGISSTTGSFSGALTASSTLSVSSTSTFTGNTTNKAIAYFADGTTYYVNASGAAKFASLTSAGAISGTSGSFSSTLAVTSTSTFTGKTTHNGGIGATSGTFSSTLSVTGATTLSSSLSVGKSLTVGTVIQAESIELVQSTPHIDFRFNSSTANYTSRFIEGLSGQLTCVGKFRIGLNYTTSTDYNFYVSGSAYISSNLLTGGSITMNSMRSMKNIINEKGLSLEELSTIKPTRFTWKDGRDDRIHVGGIADDVMKVLPEVVFKGSDGVLSMDYASAAFVMAASLIQPMTEHERRIANLERENALLKEEIRNLKSA